MFRVTAHNIQAHVLQMSLNVNSWQIIKFDGNTAENSGDNIIIIMMMIRIVIGAL